MEIGIDFDLDVHDCAIVGGGGPAAVLGTSTIALADSLQVEPDVAVINYAQGNSGIALVRDTGTPANDLATVELTQQSTDILAYIAPNKKNVTGPAGLQRYNAHMLLERSEELAHSKWDAFGGSSSIVTDEYAAGPSDITNASRVVWTTGAGTEYRYQAFTGFPADTSHSICFWHKSNTGSDHDFVVRTASSSDLPNQVVTATSTWQFAEFDYTIASASGEIGFDFRTANGADSSGDILIAGVNFGAYPRDTTYLKTTDAARYALPITHVASTLTSSTSAVEIGLGEKTFTTVASGTFERHPIKNGGFDTDTEWTKNGSATISGGVANLTASNDAIIQDIHVRDGARTKVTFDYVTSTIGNLRVYLNGDLLHDVSYSGTGSASLILKAGSTSDQFQIRSNGWIGTIDNVDVDRGVINARLSKQGDVDNFWMTGTVTSHTGTTLVVNVDHIKGSGSVSSWHIIEIDGALDESGSTNLAVDSEEFNPATTGWSTQAIDTPVKGATAPNGQATATTLTASAGLTQHWIYDNVASGDNLNSIWAKAGTADWISIASSGSAADGVFFDLANGVKGTENGGSVGKMEAYPNGWYRCEVDFAANESFFTLEIHTADNQAESWDAAGTETVLIWGAQIEAGVSSATSYIPTAGSTVSRAADDISKATAELPYVEAGAGSLVWHVKPIESGERLGGFYGTGANRIEQYMSAVGITSLLYKNNVAQASSTHTTIAADTPFKFGIAWDVDDHRAALDETLGAADASMEIPVSITELRFGSFAGGSNHSNTIIKSCVYRPRRITDTDLQTETAA